MNEPIVEVIVGLLLALSAGVRVSIPLLTLAVLAHWHEITLPTHMTWLGSEASVVLLSIACVTETLIYFIPAVGTYLKALATPLAFIGGTLVMALPLSDHNPLYQWTLAAFVGGGAASLASLGLTGARAASAPANVASAGLFGLAWNVGEMVLSVVLVVLGGICVVAGLVAAIIILGLLFVLGLVALIRGIQWITYRRPAVAA